MKSFNLHLQSVIVCPLLISIIQFEAHSSTHFRPLFHDDAPELISSRPFTILGKKINYEANMSKISDKIRDVNTRVPPITEQATSRKWQVGRVSRKQYEIVNMLWRRTNIFIEDYKTTPKLELKDNPSEIHKRQIDADCRKTFLTAPADVLTTHRPFLQPTTPSYIEFYYLVEMENETIHNKNNNVHSFFDTSKTFTDTSINTQNLNRPNDKGTFMQRSPYFRFHNNKPAFHTTKLPLLDPFFGVSIMNKNKEGLVVTNKEDKVAKKIFADVKDDESSTLAVQSSPKVTPYKNDETCGYKREKAKDIPFTTPTDEVASTTATLYDRIKFFELYDSYTQESLLDDDVTINADIENEINTIQKIGLEHIDQELGHLTSQKIKMLKRRIDSSQKNDFKEKPDVQSDANLSSNTNFITNTSSDNLATSVVNSTNTTSTLLNTTSQRVPLLDLFLNMSKTATWSEYPFAAVYIYERFQVHCDAGVISPHWLLAAGSCLSRHRHDPVGDSRSAFVTYCGERWWDPERINYVKFTMIHPRFSSRDRVRKHLYNIGLIQVVTSMSSACNNWAPLSLISHQYFADQEGSMATAVGWGLDRYDTEYSSATLPHRALSVYDGLVYSDTCPGNIGYRRAKRRDEEAVKNVYCLSLPPYLGEQDDPIHGGLLLVGGKLIALYLQEERRQWGDQSAQYTGIWRLVPWVMEVAKEPDEYDFII